MGESVVPPPGVFWVATTTAAAAVADEEEEEGVGAEVPDVPETRRLMPRFTLLPQFSQLGACCCCCCWAFSRCAALICEHTEIYKPFSAVQCNADTR